MDPCPFYRIRVENLALKLPSDSPYVEVEPLFFCKIKLADCPIQSTPLPLYAPHSSASASFTLTKPHLGRLLHNATTINSKKKKASSATCTSAPLSFSIDVFRRRPTAGCIGFGSKFVGRVRLLLDLGLTGPLHNAWIPLRSSASAPAQLFVTVNLDLDPRFVFQFDAQPECSPQVFQVQGTIRQPVFSCKFGLRNNERLQPRERKGWSVTIHDLSGSPVAAASMVTPFVASPGSDRVSRSNPGAWLILRPADGTWNPWGRLEAWCQGSSVAYRFEILSASGGITLSTGELSSRSPDNFSIDIPDHSFNSPLSTPSSSFDLASLSGSEGCPHWMYRGFVMSSSVGGDSPHLHVGAQHVTCSEDAAVFVALAAAADLSLDACRPFSHKLSNELTSPNLN